MLEEFPSQKLSPLPWLDFDRQRDCAFVEFPSQIAQAQEELLASDQAFRDWNLHYQALVNRVDYEVAFDPDLKNENQRKAVKGERLQQADFLAALDTLHHLQEKRDRAAIQLELLKNQFKVALLLEQRSSL